MFQKSDGFSLIELMVGGAILAGIALTGTQLMSGQKKIQSRIDHGLELDLLHSNIADSFRENAKDCDATFRHLYLSNLSSAAPISDIKKCTMGCNRSLDASSIPLTGGGVITYGSGEFAGALSDRTLWFIESFGQVRPTNNQLNSKTGLMIIPVNYAHRTDPSQKVTKFINVVMRFDVNDRFRQCVDASSSNIENIERDLCNSLKAFNSNGQQVRGLWNAELMRCSSVTLSSCSQGSTPQGIVGTNGLVDPACIPSQTTMHTTGAHNLIGPSAYIDNQIVFCNSNPPFNHRVRLSGSIGNRVTVVCQ